MRATAAHLTPVIIVAIGLTAIVDGLDHVKFGASRVIQPNPCGHERTGEEGVCMFAWDCLNLNGTHITFCRDRFYYGSCCKLPDGIQPPNRMPPMAHNPPSNHLDAPIRRPAPLHQQTTLDPVEAQVVKHTMTARPPVVEVQFPRDPTPRPTIPPAVPTLFPIVPPTTQRRPIVVNNHHKKPDYPLKGTTISPTVRPRPTEAVTTMAITEVPTGKPTWIIADEADKHGHPTLATAEAILTTAASPATTTRHPSNTIPTSETVPSVVAMKTTLQPTGSEMTPRSTKEFTQPTTTLTPITTMPPTELTTSAASFLTDVPATMTTTTTTTKATTTTMVSHEENSIDVTTEAEEGTTRIFSTRYPIRFPPKDKPTTTTEQPEIATEQEPVTDPKVVEAEAISTRESTDSAPPTTTVIGLASSTDHFPASTVTFTFEASADQIITSAVASTKGDVPAYHTTTTAPTNEETTILAGSTTTAANTETTITSVPETISPVELTVASTETPASSRIPTTEASTSPCPEPMDVKETTTTSSPVPLADTTTLMSETTTEYDPIRAICGRPKSFASGRIVGGDLTRFGKWPWMISLRQFKKNTFVHKCGAALLNEYWAVSAAHCVHNVSPNDILLRLGEYDLSGHDKEPLGHIERRVQIVATHPKFDAHTFEYDLALMRFYEPVSFADNIVPICIADGNETYVGQSAVVTGWGRLYEDGPLPSILQKVQVPIITNKECERMYRKAGFIEDIPDIFICAGLSAGGKDSCEGDSGGPLVLRDEDSGAWNLIGIISWGIGCAVPNQPGVYTRITRFADWMKQIIVF
ncbi:serine proteinase stubble-like [Varroa destructor]|uniref:Peptidase S1 domain-containing protein n=1 Tax=Varroa destructor TaxID=109461 RepID=A0A7M7KT54_VARDE|nr:serine proteinase stubble-like [Varroa destructor]XP_022669494.1 serine proteinase stubble-like [Varroa destructor]XP_022669505.1 serine proteinase stubble-like [Varroa destructor]XP_022669512.1 serine proteinase stubble-like [Varroa destructor]